MLSELRLIKDEYEVEQMRRPRGDRRGFEDVVARACRTRSGDGRGERWVEGTFGLRARHDGNGVGYDSIAAAGDHACTLHWIRNDGDVRDGDLLLLDAGVEADSLYTADVTRTLPVNGTSPRRSARSTRRCSRRRRPASPPRKPGHAFSRRARRGDRGDRRSGWPSGACCPVAVEEASRPTRAASPPPLDGARHQPPPRHRRARLRAGPARARTCDGELEPGMVLTVEPGLYFKPDDLLVPASCAASASGSRTTSWSPRTAPRTCPRPCPATPDDVEAWMAALRG